MTKKESPKLGLKMLIILATLSLYMLFAAVGIVVCIVELLPVLLLRKWYKYPLSMRLLDRITGDA